MDPITQHPGFKDFLVKFIENVNAGDTGTVLVKWRYAGKDTANRRQFIPVVRYGNHMMAMQYDEERGLLTTRIENLIALKNYNNFGIFTDVVRDIEFNYIPMGEPAFSTRAEFTLEMKAS